MDWLFIVALISMNVCAPHIHILMHLSGTAVELGVNLALQLFHLNALICGCEAHTHVRHNSVGIIG